MVLVMRKPRTIGVMVRGSLAHRWGERLRVR